MAGTSSSSGCCGLDFLIYFLSQGWVGTLVGALGILIAILLYRRSRLRPRLVYQDRFLPLVGGGKSELPGEVEIRFSGQPVPRLSKTSIVLWNAGSATARGADIVDGDPLRFVFSQGSEVLQARIMISPRPVNGLLLSKPAGVQNEVAFSFDFLDPGDGAIIEVLHTAEASPKVRGTMRGIPLGVERRGRIMPEAENKPARFAGMVAMAVGLLVAGISSVAGPLVARPGSEAALIMEVLLPMFTFSAALFGAIGAVLLWLARRKFPKSLVLETTSSAERNRFRSYLRRVLGID